MPSEQLSPARRAAAMATLILAGEVVFIPTFHPGRYFRTTLLESFGITELELGQAYSWYGIAAMLAYGLGGPLADRFGPRLLMSASLFATGLGSLYMATVPSLLGLKLLFAFWGVSTILAFWSPMIRATRELGGGMSQGRAFGVLDGGRGAIAWAVAAVSAVAVGDLLDGAAADTAGALGQLMFAYAVIAWVAALVVWIGLPAGLGHNPDRLSHGSPREVFGLLARPSIWLQGVVVLVAYCAYKSFAFYGHYCEDIYGLSKADAATLTAWLTALRILAALAAGFLADRWLSASGAVTASFGLLAVAFAALAVWPDGVFALAVVNMAIAWSASCALRGVYFALLQESNVPRELTGSAAGIVSFVGFTPEIFWPVVAGSLITGAREAGDVLLGYQALWALLALLAVVGATAGALLRPRRAAS